MARGQKGGRLIILGIIGAVVAVFVGVLMLLNSMYKTETYYELSQDVASRTQITTDMLSPVTTAEGTAPLNALSIEDIQGGGVFTQYPLKAGDILTPSNVGGYEDIAVGVPDEWVVTNFSVPADDAVQGRIKRGVYFDIMAVTQNGVSYPFVNVLALDATVSLNNASSSNAVDSSEAYAGQTSQYTVAMPPADAARLHALISEGTQIKLVLSPRANEYQAPKIGDYTGLFRGDGTVDNSVEDPKNLGEGTDYTFKDVKRDKFGRPLEAPATCTDGNAKIDSSDCEEFTGDTPESGE